MKRIKLFLGGYVNAINAQNLNCRSLALHLDQEKFDIGVMTYPGGSLPMGDEFRGIKRFNLLFPLYRPLRFLRHINYLRALLWCDVAYLPKGEIDGFCRFVSRLLRVKTMTTLEGILDSTLLAKMTQDELEKYCGHFAKYEPNLYAITRYIANRETKEQGYTFNPRILYLGVESKLFVSGVNKTGVLRRIIFIGNDLVRKNVEDYLDVAKLFPELEFHIAGGNAMRDNSTIQDYINNCNVQNLIYHGQLTHQKLTELLRNIDLMYFPSRSEGFPKVHLETACAGVPTLCYPDYGADEWIENWKNGIIVNNKDEAIAAIKEIQCNPAKLKTISQEAVKLGIRFDWKNLVRTWEAAFEEVMRQH